MQRCHERPRRIDVRRRVGRAKRRLVECLIPTVWRRLCPACELRLGRYCVGWQRYAHSIGVAGVQHDRCGRGDIGECGGSAVVERRGVCEQVVVEAAGGVKHVQSQHEAVRRARLSGLVQQCELVELHRCGEREGQRAGEQSGLQAATAGHGRRVVGGVERRLSARQSGGAVGTDGGRLSEQSRDGSKKYGDK